MKIYERDNFVGKIYELMDDCDNIMERFRMSDCQSCHVMDGHWLMFEQPHYRGRMVYFRPGEYRSFRAMGYSNIRFMSMRRFTDMCYFHVGGLFSTGVPNLRVRAHIHTPHSKCLLAQIQATQSLFPWPKYRKE
ncbi:gamma-crystallin M1-like [Carassius carassius]|uniref:gamma-crystallin M1-like n=1 Tax=Carassius carassius TaxID=217509 RepID=UPI0028691EE2|nr:gamma-crystallin M1-like [Carassius carassius]